MEKTESEDFKDIVRFVDRDVHGNTPVFLGLTKVRGVGFMLSNAICNILGIDKASKSGNLSAEQLEKIEECMRNPAKYGIAPWLLNRRKDLELGEDKHMISADLKLRREFDIRALRKIRCYRGNRHQRGLKVRGQRTRTTGRKGKALGVKRKKKSGKK